MIRNEVIIKRSEHLPLHHHDGVRKLFASVGRVTLQGPGNLSNCAPRTTTFRFQGISWYFSIKNELEHPGSLGATSGTRSCGWAFLVYDDGPVAFAI